MCGAVAVAAVAEALRFESLSFAYEDSGNGCRGLVSRGDFERALIPLTALLGVFGVTSAVCVGAGWLTVVDRRRGSTLVLAGWLVIGFAGVAMALVGIRGETLAKILVTILGSAVAVVGAVPLTAGVILARRDGASGDVWWMAGCSVVWLIVMALTGLLAGGSDEVPFC